MVQKTLIRTHLDHVVLVAPLAALGWCGATAFQFLRGGHTLAVRCGGHPTQVGPSLTQILGIESQWLESTMWSMSSWIPIGGGVFAGEAFIGTPM